MSCSTAKDVGVRALRSAGRLLAWALVMLGVVEVGLRLGVHELAERTAHAHGGGHETILCVGDSFTFGIKVEDQEKYPAVLERLLNGSAAQPRYAVVNVARPGKSSGWALASLDKWLQRHRPHVVVMMTGWNCNDVDFAEYRAHSGRGAGLAAIKLRLFMNDFETCRLAKYLVARVESVPAPLVYPRVLSMELYDFRDYQAIALANLDRICERLRQERVPLVLLTYPQARPPDNPYTRTEYYHSIFGKAPLGEDDYLFHDRHGAIAINAVIEHVARSDSVPLADVAAAFRSHPDAEVIIPGDHHPNAAGNRIIAATVLAVLQRTGWVDAPETGGVARAR